FGTLGTGTYNFIIEAKGHQPSYELKTQISSAKATRLAFTLKPGGKIAGTVRAPDGEPIAGARVRACLGGRNEVTRSRNQWIITLDDDTVATDGQGKFAFDSLEDGSYRLLAWHPDYQTLSRPDARPSDEALVLELSHGGLLGGRVTAASTGEP